MTLFMKLNISVKFNNRADNMGFNLPTRVIPGTKVISQGNFQPGKEIEEEEEPSANL